MMLRHRSLHKFVFEADHSEFLDEIIAGVRSLRTAQGMVIDWDTLASTDDEVEVFLGTLASEVRRAGGVLVSLDKVSDSYPLAILQADEVGARKMAEGSWRGRSCSCGRCVRW